jgi:glycosyltransferase involved in cell wall biosynthesis
MSKGKINYITNLSRNQKSGGGLGINSNVYHHLSQKYEVHYAGPINPGFDRAAKVLSKSLRLLKQKGNYHFFSEPRLYRISKEVSKNIDPQADVDFYHGATPWIKCKSPRPYFTYIDACFASYVRIFNDINEFSSKDLERLYKQEARFLSGAACVFFRSQWAVEETKKAYDLEGDNFKVVRFGAGVETIPVCDGYEGGFNLLFISKEFGPKGGYVVLKAMQKLIDLKPEVSLTIIGDRPEQLQSTQKIRYVGFLDKSNAEGLKTFNGYLKRAFALVHPTTKDTNTLVITEAAHFGCPAIASNRFAIPEFIQDGVTGVLLDDPHDAQELVDKVVTLINDKKRYEEIRKNVREKAFEFYIWDKVINAMAIEINKQSN